VTFPGISACHIEREELSSGRLAFLAAGSEREHASGGAGLYRAWTKKSEKRISKIALGARSRGRHFGNKWRPTDTRKPDDGLGKKTTVVST